MAANVAETGGDRERGKEGGMETAGGRDTGC